jgi:hypothetical protein
MKKPLLLVCLLGNILPITTHAELLWDATSKEIAYKKDTLLKFEFEARNTGTQTIEITSLQPSCGCTDADISSRTISPNETATLTAFVDTTKTQPNSKNKVLVTEKNGKSHTLEIIGKKDLGYLVSPKELLWENNERGPQSFTLHLKPNRGLQIHSIRSLNPKIHLEEVKRDPTTTEVIVKPDQTYQGTSAIRITLIAPAEEGSYQETAWVRVQQTQRDTSQTHCSLNKPTAPSHQILPKEMEELLKEKIQGKNPTDTETNLQKIQKIKTSAQNLLLDIEALEKDMSPPQTP